jgi:hypothetical protein
MNVAPSAVYEAVIDWGATGATIGMRVLDNAGATTVARVTGFTEYPTGSGVYYRDGNTAPATAGQFTLFYDDDGGTGAIGHNATDDLLVTSTAGLAPNTSNLYVSRTQLKATLELTGETYADDDIDLAVSTASRAIDAYCGTIFYPSTETRVYTAPTCDRYVDIDDLNTVTTVLVDVNGDGTYETTWTSGTDFYLDPANADTDGKPFNRLTLRRQSGRTFPGASAGPRHRARSCRPRRSSPAGT